MDITRTFHTVGQGAFYSEIFEFQGKQFVVVYDCGSYTLGDKSLEASKNIKLKQKIYSDLKTPEVDILFISHFDTDHINGCQFLNPKIIIIPFLSPEQINILSVVNTITDGETSIAVLNNPENYFPNAHIIRISPTEELSSNHVSEFIDLNKEDGLENLKNYRVLDSGCQIVVKYDSEIWEYLPYNPNWQKFFTEFKQAIQNEKELDYNQLNKIDNGSYVIKHIKKLRTIYNKLKGSDKNKHSLIVYSGPRCDAKLYRLFMPEMELQLWAKWRNQYCDPYFWMDIWRNLLDFKNGCIYFGDYPVNSRFIKSYYNFLEDTKRKHLVGTVQIPHHGAKSSKGHLCAEEDFICVISVGETNTYGHPSTDIINSILQKGALLRLITERSSSLLMQSFLLLNMNYAKGNKK